MNGWLCAGGAVHSNVVITAPHRPLSPPSPFPLLEPKVWQSHFARRSLTASQLLSLCTRRFALLVHLPGWTSLTVHLRTAVPP